MNTFPALSDRHSDPAIYPPGVAYMDGQYLPISEAKISVLDNGFLHSDATYDVVHVWQGAFFRLDDHLDRFFAGMEKLHMSIPLDRAAVTEILKNCVALSGLNNAYVEFICTRGTSPTFSRDPRDAVNRFIAFAIPFASVANPEQMDRGLHVAVTDLVRIPPASVDPTVKNYHWLDLVQGLYAAYAQGAETAILLDAEGNIAEGPGFNVFAVKEGKIYTPEYGVLLGITRQTIFDIGKDLQIPYVTGDLSPEDLRLADEVFVTSTAGGVMPVTKVDNTFIGTGSVGPITQQITRAYWQMHKDDRFRTEISYP
ncbi:aminotransferase class IV [Neptunicoccus sediminis]|uniref:aminotransferase class IV n=1 Tax=Neptunicoccus sediminis TaxID=1892596 RepID=UPI000845DA74|nr:aminotransferase class IV [Neptunicoccus sediminis]